MDGADPPREDVREDVAEAGVARPDAEEDEAAGEDDGEQGERPLRVAAQAGEEELVLERLLGLARGRAWARPLPAEQLCPRLDSFLPQLVP